MLALRRRAAWRRQAGRNAVQDPRGAGPLARRAAADRARGLPARRRRALAGGGRAGLPALTGPAASRPAAAGLWLAQDALIFPRYAVGPAAYELPPGTERIELRTPEGHRLVGNLVRAWEPSRGLLLGFTGNAWHADDFTVFLAHRLRDVDIAAFHYRGYAPSEGLPGEAAITDDAVAAYDYLVRRLRPARVLLAGFSIGSGVAAALAARRPAAGLLLVTPFDSIEAVARARYPWLPVGRLLRHPFRSDRHLADLDLPTAVIIASHDRMVPAARTGAPHRP